MAEGPKNVEGTGPEMGRWGQLPQGHPQKSHKSHSGRVRAAASVFVSSSAWEEVFSESCGCTLDWGLRLIWGSWGMIPRPLNT